MCLQLDEEDLRRKDIAQPNFVKFYQRFGNLAIWGFDDGSFQVSTLTFLLISTLLIRVSTV
jgi:hypothetical protein